MGNLNILKSCECKIDCCDKYKIDRTDNYTKDDDEEEEEDEEDFIDEEDQLEIIKRETKKNFVFKSDIRNMKVRANLIIQHKTDPWSLYKELKDLGNGSYGVVKKVCLKTNPDTIRAMKIIPKENLMKGYDNEKLLDEIIILKNLDHPNIMKLYEFFEDKDHYYMISEYCDQGDLLDKLNKINWMNQIVVKFLMEQILNAVAYLHSKGVFHGDIKLENIMLYTTTKSAKERFTLINKQLSHDQDLQIEINNSYSTFNEKRQPSSKTIKLVEDMLNYEIKLIDFGCSKIFTKRGERKSGIIGTSYYCSPEVIDDLYDEKCDEWSCGVLMYILLCGEPPFQGETEEEIFKKVKRCEYGFSQPQFDNVSKNCKDLIKKLLQPKKQRRIKAIDALKHPFFTESFNPEEALRQNKDNGIINQLYDLKIPQSKFHRAIISYMCSNYLSKDEEKKLRAVFRYIDEDGKSFLTKAKIEKALKENGKLCTNEKIKYILDALDVDKNGVIEYQEYIQGLCDKESLYSETNLKNTFNIIDNGEKGYLTSEDIKSFAFPNKTVNDEAITEYLKQFGMKIDDKLNFDNFVYIIQNNCSLNQDETENNSEIHDKENKLNFDDESLYTDENDISQNSIKDNKDNIEQKECPNLRNRFIIKNSD